MKISQLVYSKKHSLSCVNLNLDSIQLQVKPQFEKNREFHSSWLFELEEMKCRPFVGIL